MATKKRSLGTGLDSLFGAEALDISTDITVLEGMLEREGLANTNAFGMQKENK